MVLHTRAEQPWDIEVVGMELVMMEEELVMVMMTVMMMVMVIVTVMMIVTVMVIVMITVMLPSLAVKEEVMLLQNEPVKVMVVEEETEAEQQ